MTEVSHHYIYIFISCLFMQKDTCSLATWCFLAARSRVFIKPFIIRCILDCFITHHPSLFTEKSSRIVCCSQSCGKMASPCVPPSETGPRSGVAGCQSSTDELPFHFRLFDQSWHLTQAHSPLSPHTAFTHLLLVCFWNTDMRSTGESRKQTQHLGILLSSRNDCQIAKLCLSPCDLEVRH